MSDKLPSVRMPLERGGKASREFAGYLEKIKHDAISSPTFATVDLTGITDGNIPYMSATGFADSSLTVGVGGRVFISKDLIVDSDLLFVDVSPGRVGIGTTPATDFHVVGESIFMGGNVGIGTSTPSASAKLEVAGDIFVIDSAGDPRIVFGDSTGAGHWAGMQWNSASDELRIGTQANIGNQLVLKENGNVGIGVTDPDTKLEVFKAGNQLKLSFDGTDNAVFGVDTAGVLTITPSGTGVNIDNIYAGGRPWFDVMHYGAVADGGPGQTNTDNQVAFQAAIDAAEVAGGMVFVPEGKYYIASALTIQGEPVILQGVGWGVTPDGEGPNGGSWIYIEDTGFVGITINASAYGSGIRDIGMYWDQPAPGGGWAPTNYDYAIEVGTNSGDITITNVMLLNPKLGIHYIGGGRLHIDRLYGQPFYRGIVVDDILDASYFNNIQFWPFWSSDVNVQAYTFANGIGMHITRMDNPKFHNLFFYSYKYGMQFTDDGVGGRCKKFQITNIDADSCYSAIYIDGDIVEGMMTNANFQQSGSGASQVHIDGDSCYIHIVNFRSTLAEANGIRVSGANTHLWINNFWIESWNQAAGGFPGIEAAATSTVYMGAGQHWSGGGGAGFIGGAGTFRGFLPSATELVMRHGGGDVTLTVEANSVINQDLTTDATPSFDQASDTGAKPVLTLDQADVSEGFINFITADDKGVIDEAVSSLTSVYVERNGVVYRLALYNT